MILEHLIQKTKTRENAGRSPAPTYTLIDSQSVKTTAAGEERGIDGEKTKGRQRHIAVDVMGNLLAVIVHAANIHDTVSGIEPALFAFERYPSIERLCADAGYRGTFVMDVDEILGIGVDISEKIKPHRWEKLPWRWAVERTFSWLNSSRRLSKDYEITVDSAEAVVKISHLHTLLKRL